MWERVSHEEECDCGHEAHHKHHLVVASHFENSLRDGAFSKIRDRVFATSDVSAISDPDVVKYMQLEFTDDSSA